MTFDEFKNNVEQWAAERGIYEHSTPEAQLLKALSELGELADAVIKNDMEGIADGIGDLIVCYVNYAKMTGLKIVKPFYFSVGDIWINDYELIGIAAHRIGGFLCHDDEQIKTICLPEIYVLACNKGLDLMGCCEHAWNQIKDRCGRMVPGGAFVKDSE